MKTSFPLIAAGGLVTFVATKVTKNAVSASGFFSHGAMPHK